MEGATSSATRAASRSTTWRLVVFSLFVALAALPDFLTLSLLPNARVRFIEHIFPSCETHTANTCTQTTVLYFASLDTVFGLVSVWLAPKVGAYTDTNGRRGVLLAFAGVNFLSAVSLAMLVHRLEAEEESSSPYFFRFLFFLYSGCVSLFNSVGAVYGFFGMAPVQATLVDLSTTEDRLGREEASDGLLPVSSSTTSRFNGSGGASNLDLEDVNDEVLVLRPARRVVLTEGEHSMMPDVFRKLPSTTACCTAPPPSSSGGRVGVLAGEGESAPQADEELLPNVEDGFDTAEEAEEVVEVSKMATGGSFHTADDSSCQGSSSSSSQSAEGARPSFTHKSTGFGGALGYESFARVEQREPRASAGDKENISCEDEDEDMDYEAANSTLFEPVVGIAAKADDDAANQGNDSRPTLTGRWYNSDLRGRSAPTICQFCILRLPMLRAISPSAITFPKAIRYAAYIRCILSFSSQGIQEQVLYYLQQVANLQPRDTATLFFAVGLSGALVSGGLAVVSRLFLNFVHMVILCLLYYLPSFALALTAEIAVGVSFPAVACLSSIVGKAAPRDQIGRAQGFVQSFAQLGRIFGPVAFAGVYAVGSAVALPAYLPYALGAMCSLAAFGVALKMPAE
eukprot:g16401.t1